MLRRCHLAMNFHSTSSTETATQLQHWGTLCAWPSWHRHKDIHALVQFFQGTYSDVFSIFLVIDLRVLVTTFRALDLTCLGLETFTLGFGADVLTTTRWSQVADAVSKESCRSPERILGRCAHDPGGRLWMARWLNEHEGLVESSRYCRWVWNDMKECFWGIRDASCSGPWQSRSPREMGGAWMRLNIHYWSQRARSQGEGC